MSGTGTQPRKANRGDLETFVHAFRRAVETEYIDGREPPLWLRNGYDDARELCGLTPDVRPAPWERTDVGTHTQPADRNERQPSLFHDALDALETRLDEELTQEWSYPAKRTVREYAARQTLHAVSELRHRLAEYEQAVTE